MSIPILENVTAVEPYITAFTAENGVPEKYITSTPLSYDFLHYLKDNKFTLSLETQREQLLHFIRFYKVLIHRNYNYLNRENKNTIELQTWFNRNFYEPLLNDVCDKLAARAKQDEKINKENSLSIPRILLGGYPTSVPFMEETAQNLLCNYDRSFSGALNEMFPQKYRHLAAYRGMFLSYFGYNSSAFTKLMTEPENYDLFFTSLQEIINSDENIKVESSNKCFRSKGQWDDVFLQREAELWNNTVKDKLGHYKAAIPLDNPYLDEETFMTGFNSPILNAPYNGFLTEQQVKWIIAEAEKPYFFKGTLMLEFLDKLPNYVTSIASNTNISLNVREEFIQRLSMGDKMFAYVPEYDYCFSNKIHSVGYYSASQIACFRTNQNLVNFWEKDSKPLTAAGILANPEAEGDLLLEVLKTFPETINQIKTVTSESNLPVYDLNNPEVLNSALINLPKGRIAKYKKDSIPGMYLEALADVPAYTKKKRAEYEERLNQLMTGTEYEGLFFGLPLSHLVIHLEIMLGLHEGSSIVGSD